MKTNVDKVIKMSVQGSVHHPVMRFPGYRVGFDGVARIVPATAGITYNCFIGDSCIGLAGDHIEPGVSSKNANELENAAYNTLACIGNEVIVVSGDAKGAKGYVTGKHGGADHVMLAFDAATLDKLTMQDQFLIRAYGQGLELSDYPHIKVMNLDPSLLNQLNITEQNDGTISVEVAEIAPAYLMGSGLGSSTMQSGDYDIMMHDEASVLEFGLDKLRFGDLVFIQDHHNANGPDYCKGAGSIGVVVHSDSFSSGHGPGVCIILTAKNDAIKPVLSANANLKTILNFNK